MWNTLQYPYSWTNSRLHQLLSSSRVVTMDVQRIADLQSCKCHHSCFDAGPPPNVPNRRTGLNLSIRPLSQILRDVPGIIFCHSLQVRGSHGDQNIPNPQNAPQSTTLHRQFLVGHEHLIHVGILNWYRCSFGRKLFPLYIINLHIWNGIMCELLVSKLCGWRRTRITKTSCIFALVFREVYVRFVRLPVG